MKASRAIFVLEPDEVQADALRRYAERYAEAANWLIEEVMESHVTDQVQLHRARVQLRAIIERYFKERGNGK